MSEITVPIKVKLDGLEIAEEMAKRTMETACFEDCSKDYKQGFLDFGNAFVEVLKNMQKEGEDNGENPT